MHLYIDKQTITEHQYYNRKQIEQGLTFGLPHVMVIRVAKIRLKTHFIDHTILGMPRKIISYIGEPRAFL